MSYLYAVFTGTIVGALYVAFRIKAPAPPIVALAGLAGMLVAAELLGAS